MREVHNGMDHSSSGRGGTAVSLHSGSAGGSANASGKLAEPKRPTRRREPATAEGNPAEPVLWMRLGVGAPVLWVAGDSAGVLAEYNTLTDGRRYGEVYGGSR